MPCLQCLVRDFYPTPACSASLEMPVGQRDRRSGRGGGGGGGPLICSEISGKCVRRREAPPRRCGGGAAAAASVLPNSCMHTHEDEGSRQASDPGKNAGDAAPPIFRGSSDLASSSLEMSILEAGLEVILESNHGQKSIAGAVGLNQLRLSDMCLSDCPTRTIPATCLSLCH